MEGSACARIGLVTSGSRLVVRGRGGQVILRRTWRPCAGAGRRGSVSLEPRALIVTATA